MACRWGQLTLANNPNGRTSQASPYRTARPTGRPRSLNMLRALICRHQMAWHTWFGHCMVAPRSWTVFWWIFLIYRRFAKGMPFPSRATWRYVTPAALLFGASIAVMFTAATKTSVAHLEFINALAPIVLALSDSSSSENAHNGRR